MKQYRLKPADDPKQRRCDGKVILITGAGGDIGSSVALAAAREGAQILLLDNRQKALDEIYDAITTEGLSEPVQVTEDLATIDSTRCDALALQIEATFGRLDAFVHLAGVAAPLSPGELYPIDIWQRVINAGVNGAWLLTRTLVPLLRASTDPRLVFTSGIAGRKGRSYWGATAVAWAAADAMARSFADEFETNQAIRVFSVDPGEVKGAFRSRLFPGASDHDLPSPDDIADGYVFLISNGSSDFSPTIVKIRDGVLEAD
ncbi:MAG: short-chain dehydrogenase [marine bacterium B5-7]|nr:MAG: short-chain dehydrogenase [marine bacterium B5-7]